MIVKVKRFDSKVKLPTYGTAGSNGFDLYVPKTRVIRAKKQSVEVPLGVGFEIPRGYALLLLPRSSVGTKTPIRMSNSVGLIDSDYRGEVRAFFDNLSDEDYVINPGERVVQGVLVKVPTATLVEAEELETTERGTKGYGSTGK